MRPSAIRSLVLPDRVFPQNSSSSGHTSSRTKTSHQVQELTLLSINLICAVHKEEQHEICKYIAVIVCKLCNLKEAWDARQSCNSITWRRYLWGRTSVSGWIFRSVTAPSWVHRLRTHGQDHFHICHTEPGDAHQNSSFFQQKQKFIIITFIYFLLLSPWKPQAFPYVWTRCPHGWSLWKLATERSAHTWCDWRRAHGHTWSRHKSLKKG